ncbi:hypothetical protein [Streptomyces chryseus]
MSADGAAVVEAPVAEAVTLSTICSLNVRTWVETTECGQTLPCLLLTFPPPQFGEVDLAVVEATMRSVASALGATPAADGEPSVPQVGVRLTTRPREALLHFAGCRYALSVKHPRWVRALEQHGGALLAVGLDPLPQVVSVREVDEYRAAQREAGRMQFALAAVGRRIGGVS